MTLNKFYNHSFTKKILFGVNTKVRNDNDGTMKQTFKALIGPFNCAPYTRTMYQNFQLMGTKMQNTRQVAVNHQWVGSKLKNQMKYAKLDNQIYRIIDISSDETGNPNGVDILSLQNAEDIEEGVYDG